MNFESGIPKRPEFEEALLQAYPARNVLKKLIQDILHKSIDNIAAPDAVLETIILELVTEVTADGIESQEKLLIGAYVRQPGNEAMQDYVDAVALDYRYLSSAHFDYDIFVSFAEDADAAWIKKLVRSLRTKTVRLLETPVRFATSTAGGVAAAERSALFVAVLTPGYSASQRCEAERRTYLQNKNSPNTLFSVLRSSNSPYPNETAGTRTYLFHADRDYFDQIENLGRDLSETLEKQETNPVSSPVLPEPVSDPANTVYLAEGTSDLYKERAEIKAYLKQAGLTVLPEVDNSRSPDKFVEEMSADLKRCGLYVQLLGTECGATRDLPLGYTGLQYTEALHSQKPLMIWRPLDMKPAEITPTAYRQLVESVSVRAEALGDFKQALIRTLEENKIKSDKPPRPDHVTSDHAMLPWVFVNHADDEQKEVLTVVQERLRRRNFGYSMAFHNRKNPTESQNYLKEQVEGCDVLLLIYGDAPATWVVEQVRLSRKFRAGREQPFAAKVLYDGPPKDKPELPVYDPDLESLDCRLNTICLDTFLDELVQQCSGTGGNG